MERAIEARCGERVSEEEDQERMPLMYWREAILCSVEDATARVEVFLERMPLMSCCGLAAVLCLVGCAWCLTQMERAIEARRGERVSEEDNTNEKEEDQEAMPLMSRCAAILYEVYVAVVALLFMDPWRVTAVLVYVMKEEEEAMEEAEADEFFRQVVAREQAAAREKAAAEAKRAAEAKAARRRRRWRRSLSIELPESPLMAMEQRVHNSLDRCYTRQSGSIMGRPQAIVRRRKRGHVEKDFRGGSLRLCEIRPCHPACEEYKAERERMMGCPAEGMPSGYGIPAAFFFWPKERALGKQRELGIHPKEHAAIRRMHHRRLDKARKAERLRSQEVVYSSTLQVHSAADEEVTRKHEARS